VADYSPVEQIAVSFGAMIAAIGLWSYRVLYCLIVGLQLAIILSRFRYGAAPWLLHGQSVALVESLLSFAFIGSLVLAIFCAIRFLRAPEWLSWSATSLMSALLVWYSWFSLDSPFVLHELHTFDPVRAAKEIRAYQNHSLIETMIVVGFFVSLPLIHHFRRQKLQS
jgi:hypothetical protein